MKKIWIDGFEANVQQRLGSGQIAFELLKNIEKVDSENDYTIILSSPPLADLPTERPGWEYKILKVNRFKTFLAIPLALFTAKNKPDVFFSPTHYIPRFVPKGVKRVMMVFDLAYIHFPEMFKKRDLIQLTEWTKFSIINSDHILTISKASKSDILKNYSVGKDKITIVYPSFNENVFNKNISKEKIPEILNKYKIAGDYIIYIGTLQPRKNLVKLIEAVSKIEKLKLVIVGKTTGLGRQGWMFEEILAAPKKLKIEDRVIFTGFAPTEDLPFLISGAIAYVLPSLWEGFGIPVIESLAVGTPVITSNISSLPEAVGKAGLLVDPKRIDQIEQAIRTIYADKKLRARLSKLGLSQAKKFSWKKSAKEVIKVLEKI